MAIGLGAARLAWRPKLKIAVVDMQRALNECDAGKKAKEQVQGASSSARRTQLKKQREDLDRLKDDYDRKAIVLKDEERRNLEKDLESRTLDFKRKYEDFQRDLKQTDAELTSSIVEELYGIVRDYGEKHGYTLVLEASSGALLYNDKAVDVTDEIVKLHNADASQAERAKRHPDARQGVVHAHRAGARARSRARPRASRIALRRPGRSRSSPACARVGDEAA